MVSVLDYKVEAHLQ